MFRKRTIFHFYVKYSMYILWQINLSKIKYDFNFFICRYSMAYNTSKVVHEVFKRYIRDSFLENVLSHLFATRIFSMHSPFRFPRESTFSYLKGSTWRGIECLQKNLLTQYWQGSWYISGTCRKDVFLLKYLKKNLDTDLKIVLLD